MNITVPSQTIVQPPPVHMGYHQPPPEIVGGYQSRQVIRDGNTTTVRQQRQTHVQHYDPIPIIATPPPQLQTTYQTQRVPLSTNHTIMVPVQSMQQRTVMKPVERTVQEVHQVPETVYESVKRTVPVQTTRTEPHTEYHEVTEQVPKTVMRDQVVQKTVVDHVPTTVSEQVTQNVPANVVVTHW